MKPSEVCPALPLVLPGLAAGSPTGATGMIRS